MVRRLLETGYRVRACVRSVSDPARTGFLKAMPGYASGRLTLHAADLDTPGKQIVIAKGGRGGFGNEHFKRSTNQTPRKSEAGEPGREADAARAIKAFQELSRALRSG